MPSIPENTRIILVPDDERHSREYCVSRAQMVGLLFLIGLILTIFVALLAGLYYLTGQVRELPAMRSELERARARVATVQELGREVEATRALQERMLTLLGVESLPETAMDSVTEGGAVSATDSTSGLERLAALVMTPPPDLWPVRGYVTQEYEAGDTQRGVLPHLGIDLTAPEESELHAAGPGRVVQVGWHEHLGNFVEFQHGFGYVTVYSHCSRIVVELGERVDRGKVVGYLGGTGQASAPHLHFEVWKDGEALDPRQVIPGDPRG
ncbi:MAG: M23 family metallopeptidase [bacterium]